MKSSLPWLPLIPITLIAIAFRFPMLDSLPPGLNFDEGGEGMAALDVLTGQFRIWWPIGGGKEPLMAYLVQPLFWIFGPTPLALRFYTALMGLGAVLGTYFVAYRLCRAEGLCSTKGEDNIKPIFIASIAALGLATAFWHVAYSRLAFRALSNPFVAAMAMGFLWQALKTGRWRDFTFAGVFIGLLAYTYLAGRFVPIAITLFFLGEGILAWGKNQRPYLWRYWPQLSLMVGLAILIFTPLALFFLQNPAAFVDRAGAVSIFNPQTHQGDFWGLLWQTTWTTLGTYLSLTGDPNSIANIPEQPMLSPSLTICFVLGWAYALRQWHNPPYLLLICWWSVLLLPAILAPEGAPHHLRLIGTGPSTYIFVALGIWILCEWGGKLWYNEKLRKNRYPNPLEGRIRKDSPLWRIREAIPHRTISFVLLLILFIYISYQTYRAYFITWADEVDHYMTYDVYAEELAMKMAAEVNPDVVYIIPMDLRAAHEARHYSLDFLTWQKSPFHYLVVDESTIAAALTEATKDKTILKLVRWQQDKHHEADAKEMVIYLLTRSETKLINQQDFPVYLIETYQLPQARTQFAFPVIDTPIDITLDGLIQIRRAEVEVLSNQAAVAVVYAPLAPIQVDYKASLRLIAPDGKVIAQKDRTLRYNWHQPTSLWPREEVNEYYLLPLSPVPGLYEVKVVIYHPQSLAPLTQNGLVEIPLGTIYISQ